MTKPDEVTVTDAEVVVFQTQAGFGGGHSEQVCIKRALAAFLAARVPDAIIYQDPDEIDEAQMTFHNACRDAVLRGPHR